MSNRPTWADIAARAADMMLSSAAASDTALRKQIRAARKRVAESGGGVCVHFEGIPAHLALQDRDRRVLTGDVIGVLGATDDVLMFSLFVHGGFARFLDISTTADAMPRSCEDVTVVRHVVTREGGSVGGEVS